MHIGHGYAGHFGGLIDDVGVWNRALDATVLYSTHLLADAEDLCDRFGILHDGEMKYQGTPADCMQRYQAETLEQAYMKCISG